MKFVYHHKTITFPKRAEGLDKSFFTGRNGTYQSGGLQIDGYDNSGILSINPITAKKGVVANCNIDVPYEVVPLLIKQMTDIIKAETKTKTKCYLFVVEERNGEQEYSHKLVVELSSRKNVAKYLDNYLRTWYDGKADAGDDGYYFHGGTIHAKIDRWQEISADDYSILKNYL